MTGKEQLRFRIRRDGTGYSVAGPDFYVWDEDRASAIRAALQLERGNTGGARAKRVLNDRNDAMQVLSSASSEALDV